MFISKIRKENFERFLKATKENFPAPLEFELNSSGGSLEVAKDISNVIEQYQKFNPVYIHCNKVSSAAILILISGTPVISKRSIVKFHLPYITGKTTERGAKKKKILSEYFINKLLEKTSFSSREEIKEYLREEGVIYGERLKDLFPETAIWTNSLANSFAQNLEEVKEKENAREVRANCLLGCS